MKTEISRDSHQPEKSYSGVYQQQGRMLTDADWNELVEILKVRLNDALKDVVGSREGGIGGTPRHRALNVIKNLSADPLTIKQGQVYVDGCQAEAKPDPLKYPSDTPPPETFDYDKQLDFPSPPPLPENCVVYADVWERTVTHLMDERLRDKGLHGADTCTRKQTMAQVKWCPPGVDPEQSDKNPPKGDAELTVTLLQKSTQPDLCDPCASQLDVESKVGNYLFRVEVHDVEEIDVNGDRVKPTEITFKWSSENGAEQFIAKSKTKMPTGFVDNNYVYEFFSETSEKHLGVHLASYTNFPVRDDLHEVYPDTIPEEFDFVRRWDGYATFQWDAVNKVWKLLAGISGSINVAEDSSSTRADKVMKLDAVELKLQLLSRVRSESVTGMVLANDDLNINDIDIDPLTAGFDTVSTKDNEASAITKAEAINVAFNTVTDESKVWATANAILVEGVTPSLFTGLASGDLKINDIEIGAVSSTGEQSAQADAIKNAINQAFPGKEIVAVKTADDVLQLTAADGRNIDIELIGADTEKQCGFSAGTYYSSITLCARSYIDVKGNHPEHVGLKSELTPVVQFVAGDYWLADVREAEHMAGSILIQDKPPLGIEHHYLTLGTVEGGLLQPNPEADRKYAFPPLTEMTRMFMAGGDGQEVVPGEALPQPLRVGVANGEWPVEGATVRFQIELGGGSLSQINGGKTNAEGIAECEWTPGTAIGAECRVKATLVDPDHPEDSSMDMDPPVYFYANMITADQVAYEPGCPDSGQNEVHSHLASDSALDLGTDGYYTVKEVLDALLCKLRAKHIPYDPTYCDQQHPDLGWDQVKTVQEAINKICEIFGICKDCYEFLDDLRADGIVGNADGKMGFVVTANPEIPLEVEYTGGVAYVAGCRYEIDGGTITVDESTTHQTLAVNEKGQVELFIKTIGSEKYTSIAIISTFQGEIKRIIDVRFDITHLDEKVQQNFQRTAAARIDRRQFVPLLAYSINGLEYLDGRDRSFKLENEPLFDNGIPYGLCSDGDNIWVCNINGPVIAKIPRFAEDMNEIEYIPLTNDGIRGSWAVAYDGCCLWFTLIGLDSVVRLNPKDLEQREITVGKIPTGIAFDGDFIWVCNLGSNNISVIDVETCQIVRTIDLVARPWHVAFDGTYMWVAAENQLFKVEKPWGNPQFVTELTFNRGYLTFDGTHIWVSSRNAPLVKVDVVTGVPQFNVADPIISTRTLTFDGTHLWAFDFEHMYKIDPQNNSPILWDSPLDEIPFVSLFDGTHIWLSTDKGVLKKLV